MFRGLQKKFKLTEFSVNHPKIVIGITLIITMGFLSQFPKIKTDTDPKNMLPATSEVRVYNDQVEKWFALHKDMIVLGIVNDDGILNKDTLSKIAGITKEIVRIKGVAAEEVTSFTTVDNVVVKDGGLKVEPLVTVIPESDAGIKELKKTLFENPLFIGRLISKDEKATAIYIPLEDGSNGKEIADRIREIYWKESGKERYYLGGDPVARDTFGAEMFKQMGIFSPIAGMVMFIALYMLFRNFTLAASIMAVAMISIIWSMGLLIGLNFPVHIMSSMIPVFLMAISTDSIHIFNEFYFRFNECRNKRIAVLDTIKAVGQPVKYTALATASGFFILTFMHIIPVKVFGFFIAFGTIVIRLMSFSFIPAFMMLMSEKRLVECSCKEDMETNRAAVILRKIGQAGTFKKAGVVAAGIILFSIAIFGITKIRVNNNMVAWFKSGSEIREADRVINERLGGTSLAYVAAVSSEEDFMKRPAALRHIEGLQRELESLPVVGKTFSVVDYVKRINRVLHNDDPRYDRIPDSMDEVAQYLFLFGMSAKPSDLNNVVDYPYQRANIWVQLKTWDAQAMRDVIDRIKAFKQRGDAGISSSMDFKPAGAAYFNLVWNDEVLYDMMRGFIIALVVVFVILVFNFRSIKWAIVSYMPLLFTISLIYGVIGFIGKDFDMPISVLSALSLGMAVDFAIHFISRFKGRLKESGEVEESLLWTAARPGKGVMRNAVLFASAFSVMIFASLTPYITVGLFIGSMMMLSSLMTILYLPALIMLMKGWLFNGGVR